MEDFKTEIIEFINKYFEYIVEHKLLCFCKMDKKVKVIRIPEYIIDKDGAVDLRSLVKEVCDTFKLDDVDFQESHRLFNSVIIYYNNMKNCKGGFKSKESFSSIVSIFSSLFEITEKCIGSLD